MINSVAAGAAEACSGQTDNPPRLGRRPLARATGLSGRAVVATVVGGLGSLTRLDERHREQIDRRRQAEPACLFDGARKIARQFLELLPP